GILPWMTEPDMVADVDERSWLLLSGSSSPDMNFALLGVDDGALLEAAVAEVEARGLSALVMLAGDGKALASLLPPVFQQAGEMPIMSKRLDAVTGAVDPRVRRAVADDRAAVDAVLVAAYGLPADAVALATSPLTRPSSGPLCVWVLEEAGEIVSAVTAARVDDTVGLWTMATPPDRQRQGFGRALLDAVLADAHDDGAVLGLLGATPAGLPLYEATGWETDETWELYVNAPSEQFH
ncbi:MAG: family N-acetyltransferase, partial [Frankiales bacterium]|nr:family N-acetyltransferase [Frankiales bacterium]